MQSNETPDDDAPKGDNVEIIEDAASSPQPSEPAPTSEEKPGRYAEPPKWRFVNTAKKSLGYSSTAAGRVIQGKSAEELAAQSVAPPQDAPNTDGVGSTTGSSSRAVGKLSFRENNSEEEDESYEYIGRVSIPRFLAEDNSERGSGDSKGLVTPSRLDSSVSSRDIELLQKETEHIQQQQKLQELQLETIQIKQEHEDLLKEIQDAKTKKKELEKETEIVKVEKEKMLAEKSQAEAAAEVATSAAVIAPTPTPNVDTANTEEEDISSKPKRPWGMYAIIIILLCVVGALLGVMLGSNNGSNDQQKDESGLRGSENTSVDTTSKPTEASITLKPTNSPTVSSIEVQIPPSNTTFDAIQHLTCPEGTKKFDLTVNLGPNPSAITWVILDRCSLDSFYRCSKCYQDSPPNYPIVFAACLPMYNNETGEGREYVLQMIDLSNPGNSEDGGDDTKYGYELMYDDELIVGFEDGDNIGESRLQLYHFGDGNGCSEMPSEAPGPTQSPTRKPVTPYPTINIAIEGKAGCTPFIETRNTCGRAAEMEFKVLHPRGMGDIDNRLYGSSVTFVGNTSSIIAIGSGINGAPVHIYHKSVDVWQYLATVGIVQWEMNDMLFGASIDSNDQGYIVVGAPLWVYGAGDSGGVYVYKPNAGYIEWELVATLTPTEPTPSFGSSVAFDGKLIAVGSPEEDNGKGAVYIFENFDASQGNQWVQATKITPQPDDVTNGAQFGSAVSLFGDTPATLAVGAPMDSEGGSAFVYKRQDFTWVLSQKLVPRDLANGDAFGSSVVISGCSVAVSSPNDGTASTTGSGSVRVFDWDAESNYWLHNQILEPGDDETELTTSTIYCVEGSTSDKYIPSCGSVTGNVFPTCEPSSVNCGTDLCSCSEGRKSCDAEEPHRCEQDLVGVTPTGDSTTLQPSMDGCVLSRRGTSTNENGQFKIFFQFDCEASQTFGNCIAMEGNTILVGRTGDQTGDIHHFERIGGLWTKISTIQNEQYVTGDAIDFGCPLSLLGDMFVTGSRLDSTLGTLSGSALIFDLCPLIEVV